MAARHSEPSLPPRDRPRSRACRSRFAKCVPHRSGDLESRTLAFAIAVHRMKCLDLETRESVGSKTRYIESCQLLESGARPVVVEYVPFVQCHLVDSVVSSPVLAIST